MNNNKRSDADKDDHTDTQQPIVVKKYLADHRSNNDENERRVKLKRCGNSSNSDSHDGGTHLWREGHDVDNVDNVTSVVDDNHQRQQE
jgi:CDGSH-type Zn-finger protein